MSIIVAVDHGGACLDKVSDEVDKISNMQELKLITMMVVIKIIIP